MNQDYEAIKSKKSDLHKWVDTFGKTITLLVALNLFCSVIYDYAYFYALGLSFTQVPTTLTDHIRSFLIWAPSVLILFGIAVVVNLFIIRSEEGIAVEEIIKTSKNLENLAKSKALPWRLIPWLGGCGLIAYIIFGGKINLLGVIFFAIWLSVGPWLSNHQTSEGRRSIWIHGLILYMPIILIVIFTQGYTKALTDLNKNEPTAILVLNNSEKDSYETNILYPLDRGLLIKSTSTNTVMLLPWNTISSIQYLHINNSDTWKGIACTYFPKFCFSNSG